MIRGRINQRLEPVINVPILDDHDIAHSQPPNPMNLPFDPLAASPYAKPYRPNGEAHPC